MIAVNTIRDLPHYRRGAFDTGLKRLGYKLVSSGRATDRRDLLILWNRQGQGEAQALDWEEEGGTVIVCENGYLGRDANDHQFYAIAVHGHNGSGWYPVGESDRFASLGIELEAWRANEKGHVLVCGQRGIGSKTMASPHGWEAKTVARLRAMGFDKIRLRKHPGREKPETTLQQDLQGARSCVIWSSSSGLRALQAGIPVCYCAPHWIASGAAVRGLDGVRAPMLDDASRLAAMRRVAWAQRSIEEIETGEPFATILENIETASW